ncbi:unnamed protein product [Brugia timori]|uniref:Uncharacterized protein n=1 Tax=Brugia timori TaxID=42155 RepID=A0A0R3QZ15_9BILA|nr:unnamed protein product [Brugia timori]
MCYGMLSSNYVKKIDDHLAVQNHYKTSALINKKLPMKIALAACTANFHAQFKNDFRTDFSSPLSKSWSEREYYRRFYNLTSDPYTVILNASTVRKVVSKIHFLPPLFFSFFPPFLAIANFSF